jgi:hypothetical protein
MNEKVHSLRTACSHFYGRSSSRQFDNRASNKTRSNSPSTFASPRYYTLCSNLSWEIIRSAHEREVKLIASEVNSQHFQNGKLDECERERETEKESAERRMKN